MRQKFARTNAFIVVMLFFILGSTLLLEACARKEMSTLQKDKSPTPVLVFGDSLSAGFGVRKGLEWPVLLEERMKERGILSKEQSVANYSKSGEDTKGGLKRFQNALDETHPALIVLELGGNDALRKQSMENTEKNLQQMITMGQKSGAQVILVGADLPEKLFFISAKHFTSVFERLSEKNDIVLVPNILKGVNGKREYMQDDTIHPNAEGQPVMLDNVWPAVEESLNKKPAP